MSDFTELMCRDDELKDESKNGIDSKHSSSLLDVFNPFEEPTQHHHQSKRDGKIFLWQFDTEHLNFKIERYL